MVFFFQAEDGIRDAQESRGLGDVYKRQIWDFSFWHDTTMPVGMCVIRTAESVVLTLCPPGPCLLYTSDAADDPPCVDLGGRRIIKKKKTPIFLLC